ncbi:MAG TPA: endonuclease III [Candidatus Hydrogenedentes bacterium]|nr:endonuclease III [Candidatus Hydrogenedentota bacterium]HNT89824.1 endonuclease III [Candidatus Hydrogenedentota bacterium]
MAKTALTLEAQRGRARQVFERLRAAYPDLRCTLDFNGPLELLIATILAAQCTDARVNIVTKNLFRKYRKPADYVNAPIEELQEDIRPCGFYRSKARSIVNTCAKLIDRFDGVVPGTIEELLSLDGVGRKTANVILGECFGMQGIIVDTHCTRINRRLGFTKHADPVKIERDLMKVWPEDHWTLFSHAMVFHGRAVCTARAPRCSQCPVADLCPFPSSKEGKRIAK